jgi:hypothetical protein
VQAEIGWLPRMMFTPVTRSEMPTVPSPAQSPGHAVPAAATPGANASPSARLVTTPRAVRVNDLLPMR